MHYATSPPPSTPPSAGRFPTKLEDEVPPSQPVRGRGRKVSRQVLLPVLALSLLAGFGWLGRYFYRQQYQPPAAYKTESPFLTDLTQKTIATGSIVPRREVQIKPQVSGIVDALYAEAGQPVQAGQLLARIRTVANAGSVNSAQNSIQAAQVALEASVTELNRQRPLFEQGVIAQQEYNRLVADYKAKKQALLATRNDLQIAQHGASRNTGVAATLVRSTITGLLLDVPVKTGSSVVERNNFNEGTTMAVVADMQNLVFEGKLDESEVGKVREGMTLRLTVAALQNQEFPAILEYIAPKGTIEEGTTKFLIRARVQLNPGQFLRANYSATAAIVLGSRQQVLAVHERVLQFGKTDPDSVFVELVTGAQQFRKQVIKTGLSDGISVEVLKGLRKTDRIKLPQLGAK